MNEVLELAWQPLPTHLSNAFSCATTRDRKRMFTTSGNAIRAFEHQEDIWRETNPLKGHSAVVRCVGFAEDGRTLYSSDSSDRLCEWHLDAGHFVQKRTETGLRASLSRQTSASPYNGSVEFSDSQNRAQRMACQRSTYSRSKI